MFHVKHQKPHLRNRKSGRQTQERAHPKEKVQKAMQRGGEKGTGGQKARVEGAGAEEGNQKRGRQEGVQKRGAGGRKEQKGSDRKKRAKREQLEGKSKKRGVWVEEKSKKESEQKRK